ncbi:hypothetical protein [Brevundimonas sp. Root1279]|uniref:hypothetical protein n=1 Tax=Brevundimonas sp. Root1279 TaxID=1736443 RepID=UPI0006FC0A66|nr:hypothetical protein [Brevundimonas sp. Root1279]KQW80773.1 hypothetical protein ASC65_12415 [Brevundimonas sp. Root1279]
MRGTALRGYASPIVPLRPTTGSAQTALAGVAALEADVRAREAAVTAVDRQLRAARIVAAQPDAKPEAQARVIELVDQQSDARTARDAAVTALSIRRALLVDDTFGTTNVQSRFVVVREANAFGAAIAASLQKHGATLGAAVTRELQPDDPFAWDAETRAYATALVSVRSRQADYDAAVLAGGVEALAKQNLLWEAKVAANAAAVAAGEDAPYPNVLRRFNRVCAADPGLTALRIRHSKGSATAALPRALLS